MRIYADFNGVVEYSSASNILCINLTGYGTLASISSHQIVLKEGQFLELTDPGGLSVSAEVFFDKERVSKNCSGWFAKFSKSDMTEGEELEHDYDTHLCFKCRENMKQHLDKVGRQFSELCPFCGTSVMYSLSSPRIKRDAFIKNLKE
jgi:hypothetical protein